MKVDPDRLHRISHVRIEGSVSGQGVYLRRLKCGHIEVTWDAPNTREYDPDFAQAFGLMLVAMTTKRGPA